MNNKRSLDNPTIRRRLCIPQSKTKQIKQIKQTILFFYSTIVVYNRFVHNSRTEAYHFFDYRNVKSLSSDDRQRALSLAGLLLTLEVVIMTFMLQIMTRAYSVNKLLLQHPIKAIGDRDKARSLLSKYMQLVTRSQMPSRAVYATEIVITNA